MLRFYKIIFTSIFLLLIGTSSIYSMEEETISEFKLFDSYSNSFKTSLLSDVLLDIVDTKNQYSTFLVYEVQSRHDDKVIGLVYVLYSSEYGYQIVPTVKTDSTGNDLLALELINATVSYLKIKKVSIPTSLVTKLENIKYLGSYYEKFDPNNATYIEKTVHGEYKIIDTSGTTLNEFTALTTFFTNSQWISSFTLKEMDITSETYFQVLNTIANTESWKEKDHLEILREVHSVFSDIHSFIDPTSLLKAHHLFLTRPFDLSDRVSLFDYLEALSYLDFSKINLNQDEKLAKSYFGKSKDISDFYMYIIENFPEAIDYRAFYKILFSKFFSNFPIELKISVKYQTPTHSIRSNRLARKGEKNLYDILLHLHINHPQTFDKFVSIMHSYNPNFVVRFLFVVPSIAISEILKLNDDELNLYNIYKNVDNLSYDSVLEFIKKNSTKSNTTSINRVMEYKKLIASLLLKSTQPINLKWAFRILDQINSHPNHGMTIVEATMIYSIFSGLNHLDIHIQYIKAIEEIFIKSNLISDIKKLLIYSAHRIDYKHFDPSDPDLLDSLPKSVRDLIDKIDTFSQKIVLTRFCIDQFSLLVDPPTNNGKNN